MIAPRLHDMSVANADFNVNLGGGDKAKIACPPL
jgi:hypothetical protein